MQGQVAHLAAFIVHSQVRHPAPWVDVPNFERGELLASQSVVQQHRKDGAIASTIARLGPRRRCGAI